MSSDSAGLMGFEGSPGATYRVTTNSRYWSAVWLKPIAPSGGYVNYDLYLHDPVTGANLGQSVEGGGPGPKAIDFVAINTNVLPLVSYDARVTLQNGYGSYQIGFRQQDKVLPPMTVTPQPVYTLGIDEQNMIIRDVWLDAGECLAVHIKNAGFSKGVMGVIPADAPYSTVAPWTKVYYGVNNSGPTATVRHTATVSGWHGFFITNIPVSTSPFATLPKYQRVPC